jgi:hypothetical protein
MIYIVNIVPVTDLVKRLAAGKLISKASVIAESKLRLRCRICRC